MGARSTRYARTEEAHNPTPEHYRAGQPVGLELENTMLNDNTAANTATENTETETAIQTVGLTASLLNQALLMMETASKDPMRATLDRVAFKKSGAYIDLWSTNGHSMTHAQMLSGMGNIEAGKVYYLTTSTAPALKLALKRFKKDPGAMLQFEQRGDRTRFVFEGVELWRDDRGEFPIEQVERVYRDSKLDQEKGRVITLGPDLLSQIIKAFNGGMGDGLKIYIKDEKSAAFIERRMRKEADASMTAVLMPMRW